MEAWLVALTPVMASSGGSDGFIPCVHEKERTVPVQSIPPMYRLQLVGVGFDSRMQPTAVIRHGFLSKASSRVYKRGDNLWGRVTILAVGTQSVLLRADGKLYSLRLKNRAEQQNWNATVQALPLCEQDSGKPPNR